MMHDEIDNVKIWVENGICFTSLQPGVIVDEENAKKILAVQRIRGLEAGLKMPWPSLVLSEKEIRVTSKGREVVSDSSRNYHCKKTAFVTQSWRWALLANALIFLRPSSWQRKYFSSRESAERWLSGAVHETVAFTRVNLIKIIKHCDVNVSAADRGDCSLYEANGFGGPCGYSGCYDCYL